VEKALSNVPPESGREERVAANPVSRGIGIGRALFLNGDRAVIRSHIQPVQVEGEIERFRRAVAAAAEQLILLTSDDSANSASGIFDAQRLILEHSSLVAGIETYLRENLVNAEWAVRQVCESSAERQRRISDKHFSEKSVDVSDVADRLIASLNSVSNGQGSEHDAVIIVKELLPSRLMEIARSRPRAIICEQGGWTSHSSILARELRLPVVAGVRNIDGAVSEGERIAVDANVGEVIIRPCPRTLDQLNVRADGDLPSAHSAGPREPTMTKDGVEISIRVNADAATVYQNAAQLGARGIGLYRTESIFDKFGGFPPEDFQTETYREAGLATGSDGARIRTFDIGAGRVLGTDAAGERNPALGLRAIRLSLTEDKQFRIQIRAILKASHGLAVDIVIPMVSSVDEVLRVRELIGEEAADLENRGIPIGSPRLGAMIEVPSAVLTVTEIAETVDFLCLGTNDLVQYLLAVDRDNDLTAAWYQSLHPAVFRAIDAVVHAGRASQKPVTICGEMAGSPFYVPVLIGLGARELSININSIEPVRRLIAGISTTEARDLVEVVSKVSGSKQIEEHLRAYYTNEWSEHFSADILSKHYR